MRLNPDEIRQKLNVLRRHSSEFYDQQCDYFDIWSMETNNFVATEVTLEDLFKVQKAQKGSSKHLSDGRSNAETSEAGQRNTRNTPRTEGHDISSLSSLTRHKKPPTGQVVPRLLEFATVDEFSYVGGMELSARDTRTVRTMPFIPRLLQKDQMRKQLFRIDRTPYSNKWWRECHKSEFDRLRKVIQCIASYNGIKDISYEGDDDTWCRAVQLYNVANKSVKLSKSRLFMPRRSSRNC